MNENDLPYLEWLEWYKNQDLPNYPMPSVTVDNVVFNRSDEIHVLVIRRKGHPFKNMLALPGGFVNPYENLQRAAARELKEETGLESLNSQLVGVYGDKGRDPRGWTISIAFSTVVEDFPEVIAMDDASEAFWYKLKDFELEFLLSGDKDYFVFGFNSFAFDHAQIISDSLKMLK
ncbi:hypothetical protein A5882_003534 [Enterococcus sp. 4E1_DIV0656]|uniref:NUDIX domain-containing protein n=1 Tax=Enterococcus sp. 4E1_DIV0656 TaxID=1834180 RepID=UPI000A3A5D4F|nr:NUDIX hydrolase [Enterococcus sp. 4E1_DIV0656]OTO09204.1 hypothetical protein A5882_003534 [Enterococcus sp. 4E1_DIV0656]